MPQMLTEPAAAGFAAEVLQGLTQAGQRTLPCKYLYDEVGSRLFEAICALPEYGLTAADIGLLRQHACAGSNRKPGRQGRKGCPRRCLETPAQAQGETPMNSEISP